MKKTLILTALALAAGTSFAQAPTMGGGQGSATTPRIEQREQNQERRIEQGVKSGQLTPREAGRLEHQQNRIERAEAKAGADGKVTAKERARIEHMQDKASRDIRREKHDAQRDRNHDGRKDRPSAPRQQNMGRN